MHSDVKVLDHARVAFQYENGLLMVVRNLDNGVSVAQVWERGRRVFTSNNVARATEFVINN